MDEDTKIIQKPLSIFKLLSNSIDRINFIFLEKN